MISRQSQTTVVNVGQPVWVLSGGLGLHSRTLAAATVQVACRLVDGRIDLHVTLSLTGIYMYIFIWLRTCGECIRHTYMSMFAHVQYTYK